MPNDSDGLTAGSLFYTERGAGSTVVLIHAFPLDHEMWTDQVQLLAGTHRVITPDVHGFGKSAVPPQDWSIDDYAIRVAQLLDDLRIAEPVILGGLSMGGYIALAFARRYPERLRGLILADTRADADSEEAKANRDKTIAAMASQSSADLIEQMLPKMLSEHTRKTKLEVVQRVRQLASSQSREGVIAGLKALRDRTDSSGYLKGFSFPVLVIVGAEDVATPPALAEAMMKELPNATLEIILDSGHLSNLEMPEAFNAVVLKWMKGI